ncbi:M48 family metalloprotease [uncultured Bacteroides sp.]|uniref:M48 family metalloprotease n=1 Tax=uncultured Bacteroides sp. TaxID=162156 RepID=UPI002AAAD315|nr:M48 family metalloprotease [uncultured Bacteroides sp.]
MKKIFIVLCIFSLWTYNACSQKVLKSFPFNINGTLKKDYEEYKAGTPVNLCSFVMLERTPDNENFCVGISINHIQIVVPYSQLDILNLEPTENNSFWEYKALQNDLYKRFIDKGYQYNLRQDLREESADYIRKLSKERLLYEDSYIEDYVNSIFASVIYQNFNDKRTESLKVYILKSPNPDSYMQPDGSLIVTTGLLSVLDSEEELTAIIASEVAHHVLDHAVINVNKEISRERAAAFWGSVAAGVLQAGEEYLMDKSQYYVPGTATVAVTLVSAAIAEKMSKRMGMSYSRSQEKIADRCAMEFLSMKKMDPSALPSALSKIKKYFLDHKDYYTLSKYGTYAEFDKRINRLGEYHEFSSHSYQKAISSVNTFNAIIQIDGKHYAEAAALVQKNVDQKVATDGDLVILAKTNMGMYNTEEKNQESLSLIQQAKSIAGAPNLNTDKQEILALLRLKKQSKAASALQEYIDHLTGFQEQTRNTEDITWASSEITWAKDLLQRVNIM